MELKLIRNFRSILRKFERELFFQNTSSCCGGVSMAQCHTLLEIQSNDNITVTQLSENLMLNKSTISRTVDGLVNTGLICREIPKDNRRTTVLSLTDAGNKTCQNINWNNDKFINEALSVLNDNERDQFIQLFNKITSKMIEMRIDSDSKKKCC